MTGGSRTRGPSLRLLGICARNETGNLGILSIFPKVPAGRRPGAPVRKTSRVTVRDSAAAWCPTLRRLEETNGGLCHAPAPFARGNNHASDSISAQTFGTFRETVELPRGVDIRRASSRLRVVGLAPSVTRLSARRGNKPPARSRPSTAIAGGSATTRSPASTTSRPAAAAGPHSATPSRGAIASPSASPRPGTPAPASTSGNPAANSSSGC
jgi:hypothetical protein